MVNENPPADETPASDGAARESAPVAASAAAAERPAKRSIVPQALAITGIAVGAALLLGLVFAAGVAVGRIVPDGRGPGSIVMGGPGGDRGGDRGPFAERRDDGLTDEQREQFHDEMIERWQELQQQNG